MKRSHGDVDHSMVREVVHWIDNDHDLYRQQFTPIVKNLATKHARGVYDHTKAKKLWSYLVPNAIERLHGKPNVWSKPKERSMYAAQMTNIATRDAIADVLEGREFDEIVSGQYSSLLPKKYKKNPKRKRRHR